MPIDPRIPLSGRQPQFGLFDLGDTLRTAEVINRSRQQREAGQLSIDETRRQQAEAEAIRRVYGQHYAPSASAAPLGLAAQAPPGAVQEQQLGGAPTAAFPAAQAPAAPTGLASLAPQMAQPQPQAPQGPQPRDQQAFIRQLYTISPKAGREAELHAFATKASQLAQHMEQSKYLEQITRGILEQDTQQAYELGIAQAKQAGIPVGHLPPVYDRQLVQSYHGMALDGTAKVQRAKAQLDLAQAQRAQAKAPDYGYGDELDSAIYARYGQQIPPGQPPTPAMVAEARRGVLDEGIRGKAAESAATATGRLTGEEAYREGRPASEYYKDKVANLIDVSTGRPIDPSRDYKDVLAAQRRGEVRQLPQRQAERLQVVQEAIPIIQQMQEYVEQIYGPGGELATANPNSVARLLKGSLAPRQMQEEFPLLTEAARFVDTNAGGLARSLKGEVGAMSEGDVERALAGLPNFRSTFSLGLGLGVAFTRGGIGPTVSGRPSLKTADTATVARGVLQATIDTLNRTSGGILGKRNFQYEDLAWPVYPRPAPAAQAPPSRTMSERDVTEAMRQTGRTRQEVLEAARAKGYTVP